MKYLLFLLLLATGSEVKATISVQPDSVYLFAYSRDDGRSGLNLAWSVDRQEWHAIGDAFTFLFSDFGTCGGQKRIFDPYLFQEESGRWRAVWSLNDTVQQLAHASSENLYEWKPQSYPVVMEAPANVQNPEVSRVGGDFVVSWESHGTGKSGVFQLRTADFTHYGPTTPATVTREGDRETVGLNGAEHTGVVRRVAWELVDGLIKHYEWTKFHNAERAETMAEDPIRYWEQMVQTCHLGNRTYVKSKLSEARAGTGQTLYGLILEIIADHPNIELVEA